MKATSMKIATVAVAGLLSAGLLAGCQAPSAATTTQTPASAYAASVSSHVKAIGDDAAVFADAVARADVPAMRKQVEAITAEAAEISKLEVPAEIAEVGQGYKDGCEKLTQALDAYVVLFEEIADAQGVNAEGFAKSLAAVQALYDEGIEALKAADQKAITQ